MLASRGRRGGPILRFALSGAALLVLVAAIGAVALRQLAKDEALADARSVTVAFSRGMLHNAVTPGVLRGDRAAIATLDRRVHQTMLGHPVVRLKVWSPNGRIVYSDAAALIGRRFPLPTDLRESLADGAVRADVSDLDRPENRYERGHGPLVEVYLPLRVASGELVMVEAYHPADRIDAASRRIWSTFLPMLLALLAALAAVQLPLAWAQARRARADARERERLARDAELALQSERGRIATELHQGIVQDLAGVAYAMRAAASLPDDASPADLRGALRQGAEVCRTSMTRMRELLGDLRAPDEHRPVDLGGTIDALAAPLRAAGAAVRVDVALGEPPSDEAALLVHRAVREVLLAVRAEAGVTSVAIRLAAREREIVLTVDHDVADGPAHGDEPPVVSARLRGLAERLEAAGGSLTVQARAGLGARYTAKLIAGATAAT